MLPCLLIRSNQLIQPIQPSPQTVKIAKPDATHLITKLPKITLPKENTRYKACLALKLSSVKCARKGDSTVSFSRTPNPSQPLPKARFPLGVRKSIRSLLTVNLLTLVCFEQSYFQFHSKFTSSFGGSTILVEHFPLSTKPAKFSSSRFVSNPLENRSCEVSDRPF